MTRFEAIVFDFVRSSFGKEAAEKKFCFWSDVVAVFKYMLYLHTPISVCENIMETIKR